MYREKISSSASFDHLQLNLLILEGPCVGYLVKNRYCFYVITVADGTFTFLVRLDSLLR